jgi:hypothetical protein
MAKKKSGIRSFGPQKGKKKSNPQKQTLYKVYSGVSNHLIKNLSRLYGRSHFLNDPIPKACKMIHEHDPDDFFRSADFEVFVIEQKWKDIGAPAIFPQSGMLIEKLFDANFTFEDDVKLNLPHETFSIAMPKDFKVNDALVPGFMVNIQKNEDFIEEHVIPMIKKTDQLNYAIPTKEARDRKNDKVNIDLIYIDPKNRDANIHLRINEKVLGKILNFKNMSDFEDYLESEMVDNDFDLHADFIRNKDMTLQDAAVQFAMLKTLAVINVYLEATNNQKLKKGLPGQYIPSFLGTDVSMRPQDILDVQETEMITKLRSNPEAHYRKFHFRNLRHEKFYGGKHKDKDLGSRWVFVNDSVINEKLDAETMTM